MAEITPDAEGTTQGQVELVTLRKDFGAMRAVDDIALSVRPGEFLSLLGPSGCGKTTTLRMIAGFETPTSGQIMLDGVDVVSVPPHKRNVHTVFQSYALFPHLNVFDNVAFGLRRSKAPQGDVRRRVGEALEMVQLTALERRKVTSMSGGQQQRVALARALVCRPAVLLLDEPLGALDARLRKNLQVELKALQERVGITFVYVTHDQDEALTMSDRIGVMHQGRLEQVASPQEIYDHPTTTFVAEFLGSSNLMPVTAASSNGAHTVRLGEHRLEIAPEGWADGRGSRISIRPERIELEDPETDGPNRLPGTVRRSVFHGSAVQVLIDLPTGDTIDVLVPHDGGATRLTPGAATTVHLPSGALRLLHDTTTNEEPT